MPIYRRHSSKTGEWFEDRLRPSRLAIEADAEVWFVLPREGNEDQVWEALDGTILSADLVELRAVPALTYGVGFGDKVTVIPSAEGFLVVNGVGERSTFATFRIWLGDETPQSVTWQQATERFAQLGCLVDVYSEKLIALACEAQNVEAVRGQLEFLAGASGLAWEQSA